MKPTTVKELLLITTWAELEEALLFYYPDELPMLHAHKELYWKLYNLKAKANKLKSYLVLELYTEDDVDDMVDDGDFYGEDIHYHQPDMEKWSQYLGYFIHQEDLNGLKHNDIIAHLFFDVAYAGFSQIETDETK